MEVRWSQIRSRIRNQLCLAGHQVPPLQVRDRSRVLVVVGRRRLKGIHHGVDERGVRMVVVQRTCVRMHVLVTHNVRM